MSVVHRALHTVSLVACLLVAISFVLFAHDQVAGASRHQQAEVAGTAIGSGSGPAPAATPKHQPRAFIDSAAKTLTSPFSALVSSNNPWVSHGVPAVLGLLVYGLGLGIVARVARPGTYLPS